VLLSRGLRRGESERASEESEASEEAGSEESDLLKRLLRRGRACTIVARSADKWKDFWELHPSLDGPYTVKLAHCVLATTLLLLLPPRSRSAHHNSEVMPERILL
jgi:hypothetical protein